MACPYFYPVEMRGGSATLPLGESWDGVCRAVPGDGFRPDTSALRQCCNLGYARRSCPRFPAGEGPDAVRFAISSHEGDTLRIYYTVERDHHPFSHGPLACSLNSGQWSPAPSDDTLLRQAQAYTESYLRRKKEC